MTYVILREGTESYEQHTLQHFGIKGQKWGIRRYENEDGTLTEEGKLRYRSSESQKALSDTVKSSIRSKERKPGNWKPDREDSRTAQVSAQLMNHPVVKDAARRVSSDYKKYKEAEDAMYNEMDRFYNNKRVYEKYLNKAVDHFMKEVGPSWGSREQAYDWFKYDDGDQGERSSVELFKKSPEGKKLASLEKSAQDAYKRYSKACVDYVSEYTGAYGNEKISYLGGYERTVNARLSDFVKRTVENT